MKSTGIQMELTGMQIRRLCKEKGKTVRDIQEYLGLACPQSVYRWMKGLSLPSLDHLYALAECLGVEIGALVVGEQCRGCSWLRRKDFRILQYYRLWREYVIGLQLQ